MPPGRPVADSTSTTPDDYQRALDPRMSVAHATGKRNTTNNHESSLTNTNRSNDSARSRPSARAPVARCSPRSMRWTRPALPAIALEYPPNRELGDLGTPVAFELARRLRKAPRAIAQEIAGAFGTLDGHRAGGRRAQRLPQLLPRPRRRSCSTGSAAAAPPRRPAERRQGDRRAHGDQPEQGGAHRPPAQLRARRHAGARAALPRHPGRGAELHRRHRRAGRRRRRRLPRARAARRSTRSARSPTSTRFDYYCWDLYARVTEWYEQDKERLAVRAETLHDIEHGGNENADDRRLHRRPHRPLPPEDDGADERRLRPADVGRRHPAAEVLGAGVRRAEGEGRGLPADGGPARRLLGDADPGGSRGNPKSQARGPKPRARQAASRRATRTTRSARRSSSAPTASSPTSARTSPTSSGSSGCSAGTSTTACSPTRPHGPLWATCIDRTARPTIRCSAAPPTSTTSSTSGSRTCRSC